ncbi:MAG: CDP-diacylglycerol--serine O-phosphatidyltransferase [Deltaproteobacteria bacterium]|nr:CDP-diacylglycerol--serine O-phosphatidyltransferase [Candidatus Anaeroferrophillacea bacterium]
MIRGVYILPNLFTMGNLFCGFYAIIAVFQEHYEMAAVAVVLANVFDILDGKVARLMRATSRFGMELDSLADLVSFGVAPALLVFSWALTSYGRFGWLAAFLFTACGTLRLARFNVQADSAEKGTFTGLPIPAAASMIATTVLMFYHFGGSGTTRHVLVLLLSYALAFLMVSNIRYHSFKDSAFIGRAPFFALVLVVMFMIVIAAEPQVSLFLLCTLYVVSGPALHLLALLGLRAGRFRGRERRKAVQ